MDRIRSALSSKGSEVSHTTGTTRFIPDKEEVVTLQWMGRHSRVKSYTILDGQEFKVRKESLTKLTENPIRRGVFFMNTILSLRRIHTELINELSAISVAVHQEGALTDDDFPPQLREFLKHDKVMRDLPACDHRFLLDNDVQDLAMQIAALRLFGH